MTTPNDDRTANTPGDTAGVIAPPPVIYLAPGRPSIRTRRRRQS
jgi:hypothetical protein